MGINSTAYHIQQAQRRAEETRLRHTIDNSYDSAKKYNDAKIEDNYLKDSIRSSASITANARNKLSRTQDSNQTDANKFRSRAIFEMESQSKLGWAEWATSIQEYPYVKSYKKHSPLQSFLEMSSDTTFVQFQDLLSSYRAKNFRKFINFRIYLIESMLIKTAPFDANSSSYINEFYSRTVKPLFSALETGFNDDNLTRIESTNSVEEWLPNYGIEDSAKLLYQGFDFFEELDIDFDAFLLYWSGYGDVLFSSEFESFVHEFFVKHHEDLQGSDEHLFNFTIEQLPKIMEVKNNNLVVHNKIVELLNKPDELFKSLNTFENENATQEKENSYVMGY